MAKNVLKSIFIEHDSMAKPLQKGKGIFIFCMTIVAILNFIVFYLIVNVNSIALAFKEFDAVTNTYKVSFGQFERFFSEFDRFLPAFRNTMMYFWSGLAVSIPLSFVIGYFLFKKVPGFRFFRVMFFLPSMISGVVLVIMYRNMLLPNSSFDFLLQDLFGTKPFTNKFVDPHDLNVMILLFTVWTGFGSSVILFQGAMKRIPESVLEAAKLDGVGIFVELTKIIIPLVWPTIITLLTVSFSAFLTASGPIMLFVKNPDVESYTISYWIYWLITFGGNDYEYASAIGVCMTIATLPIAFSVRAILNKLHEKVEY